MNASYDLNNLNVPNGDRIIALMHLRIDSFTPAVSLALELSALSLLLIH